MCEIGTSRRSVYQMKASREQALGEGSCVRVTERGKEACECMGKRRVCRLPSVRLSPLECILTKGCYRGLRGLCIHLAPVRFDTKYESTTSSRLPISTKLESSCKNQTALSLTAKIWSPLAVEKNHDAVSSSIARARSTLGSEEASNRSRRND